MQMITKFQFLQYIKNTAKKKKEKKRERERLIQTTYFQAHDNYSPNQRWITNNEQPLIHGLNYQSSLVSHGELAN